MDPVLFFDSSQDFKTMKTNFSIQKINRVLLFLCAVILIIVVKVPMWRIDLNAPQYPEGLSLFIYPNHLGGNIDIVNGLNHYIGMKPLHTEDFIEFKILPAIIIAFATMLLITAFFKKRWMLTTVLILFVVFGVVAMIDFWRWEYNYGHNLNPDAPIIVPGMAYQPPLIGFKQLLNFGAYSVPAIGGFLFVGVGILLVVMNIIEYKVRKKLKSVLHKPALVLLLPLLFFISSCNNDPAPIIVGKDICSYCKMPVSDNRFGAEIVTNTGKIYKFDDAHCILSFLHSPAFKKEEKSKIYFVDFSGNHSLIPATTSLFLKSEALRSPMNGNVAAFSNPDSMEQTFKKFSGIKLSWTELDNQ